jgi:hypothetical protein
MIDKIYPVLINFAKQQLLEGVHVYGLKIYPGRPVEWVIEDSTSCHGVIESGKYLRNCLDSLSNATGIENEDIEISEQAATVYKCWSDYCSIHHFFHRCDRDIYPCLTIHPDNSITIEDVDSDFHWHMKFDTAIAVLSECVNSKVSLPVYADA